MTSENPLQLARPRELPEPTRIGSDNERTRPTQNEPIIAPGIEPIVPNTITANAGRRMLNPTSGLTRTVAAKNAPPKPDKPADRNAL